MRVTLGGGAARACPLLFGSAMAIRRSVRGWLVSSWAMALALVLLVGVGCMAPTPVVRLRMESPGTFWVAGRQTAVRELEGVRAAAAFERGAEGTLTLRLEVQNLAETPVDVSPEAMWFNHCRTPDTLQCGPSTRVKDPERMLEDMDQSASNERAAAVNDMAAGVGLLLLGAVVETASAASGDRSSSCCLRELAADTRNESRAHEEGARSLDTARMSLANAALRKTTLFAGQGVAGEVYVPVDFQAPFVRLNVAVGERQFVFVWRQETLNGRATTSAPPPAPIAAQRHEAGRGFIWGEHRF